MTYKVTQQFTGARETVLDRFSKLDEAKKKALDDAEKNARMKINVIYRIYEFEDDIVETIDNTKLTFDSADQANESSGQGGQSQGATFRPTPLEMSPRPKGTPPKYLIDPEDDKEKDKDK